MNSKQVDCFVQAATYLNFHRAAEKLYLSQPALTYQIKALETELGFELFDRGRDGVRLTRAGASLYADLIPIRTSLDKAVAKARACAQPKASERLTLAWPPSIVDRTAVLGFDEAFRGCKTGCELIIVASDEVCSIAMLDAAAADVVVTVGEDVRDRADLAWVPLFEARLSCLVSASHPLARAESVSWGALQSQTLLLAPPRRYPGSYARMLDAARANMPAGSIVFLDDVPTIDINVEAGKGVAVRPVRSELLLEPCGGIVAVPFEPAEKLAVGLAYRAADENPALGAFVRAAKACAGR